MYLMPLLPYLVSSIENNCSSSSSSLQDNSQSIPLVRATLETLLKFLNWIPLGYIFETKLISSLIYKVSSVRV